MLKYNIILMLIQYLVFVWILNKRLDKLNAQLSRKDGFKLWSRMFGDICFYLTSFEQNQWSTFSPRQSIHSCSPSHIWNVMRCNSQDKFGVCSPDSLNYAVSLCIFCHVYFTCQKIPETSSCKYRGIILCRDLNWADQVNYTVKKSLEGTALYNLYS
jgi:hypothetical protein